MGSSSAKLFLKRETPEHKLTRGSVQREGRGNPAILDVDFLKRRPFLNFIGWSVGGNREAGARILIGQSEQRLWSRGRSSLPINRGVNWDCRGRRRRRRFRWLVFFRRCPQQPRLLHGRCGHWRGSLYRAGSGGGGGRGGQARWLRTPASLKRRSRNGNAGRAGDSLTFLIIVSEYFLNEHSCDSQIAGDGKSSENLSPDELELLAKLEEQNRLLEADSKSLRSMNGSRRNSGSSLVSSSSASSNLSHLEEDTWILWGRIVNEWEEWRKRKEKLLKELIRKGIPHHFRAIVWQLLCSATDMPVKNQYSELLKMSSPCEKLIRRDIARTYPEHEFFKGQDSLGQEVLFNVMKAYSLVDREVGYCQGSAFIVGLLLMQMPEEEAFCVFVRLMQEYRLRELFKPTMAELGLCIYQFEYMLQEQLPELNIHFRSQSFLTSMYASSWFLTLFLTTFPLPVATRVFDIFMYEGLEIIFRVGMALLQFNQTELMQLDMEGMSQYFQKVIPHQFDSCPDKLILKAYQVKYNPKKMKRLEKEYIAIKNREMEEQIEIKRLRTENRLLKQRIETLEKVRSVPNRMRIHFLRFQTSLATKNEAFHSSLSQLTVDNTQNASH
ncbi:EVI5-like [Crotalus adamanteus]|uniref:EVI5-like n=1 Tax=Crotalus adamanteus TaxID=8729 RepID=A0AAW1BWE1_CROAD